MNPHGIAVGGILFYEILFMTNQQLIKSPNSRSCSPWIYYFRNPPIDAPGLSEHINIFGRLSAYLKRRPSNGVNLSIVQKKKTIRLDSLKSTGC
jgi:hypothetical protein